MQMNMSVLVALLRSYFSSFSHDVIWHVHSTQRRIAVGVSSRLPRTLKMAKLPNFQTCDVIQFIERMRSHPISCDSRDDEYKLAEKNP